jgi:hypothetical protein
MSPIVMTGNKRKWATSPQSRPLVIGAYHDTLFRWLKLLSVCFQKSLTKKEKGGFEAIKRVKSIGSGSPSIVVIKIEYHKNFQN